jgi:aspartate kinase
MNSYEGHMLVKKLGGENAAKINTNLYNILNDFEKGIPQAIVVSAMRSESFNTTDKLIETWEYLKKWQTEDALEVFDTIEKFHVALVSKEVKKDKDLENKDKEIIGKIKSIFAEKRNTILSFNDSINTPDKKNDYQISDEENTFSLLWFWENLSAIIINEILNVKNKVDYISQFVNLENIINPPEIQKIPENKKFLYFAKQISSQVEWIIVANKIALVPWYAWKFPEGMEATIWRWYSDATAAALSIWIKRFYENLELQIHKSVLWLLSSDPFVVKNGTKLLGNIDYIMAKEITGSRGAQAKLLHSQVLRKELLDAQVKVRILDPENTSEWYEWTVIDHDWDPKARWVQFVWGKPDELLISISLDNMSEPGLMYLIWRSFSKRNISISQVSTSETSLTLTCDKNNNGHIDKAIKVLKKVLRIEENDERNFIKKQEKNALVYVIWQNMKWDIWILADVADTLKYEKINTKMITQWAEERAIIIWVDEKDRKKAIRVLHKKLIENK